MSFFDKGPAWRISLAALVMLSLFAAGCGGGGGGTTGDRTGEDTLPVILGLETPLGMQGIRGVGAEVAIVYQLRDREFDPADVEVQFGVDLDRDGSISDAEYRPATPAGGGDGTSDLSASPGDGSLHSFVWDSLTDIQSGRHVTQDYVYTNTGRVARDDFGEPIFQSFPGCVIRIRPMADGQIGAWRYSEAFDVNNNNRPQVRVDSFEIPAEGQADGTVNEQVLVNWTAMDADADPLTIAVDWVSVPAGYDVGNQTIEDLEGLPWTAATSGALGEGTFDLAASPDGVSHLYSWDSVPDAGTVNQWVLLRFRPIDGKLEVGDWFYASEPFHLDNYTIFTDPDASLANGLHDLRATLLRESVESVLLTGGAGTEGGGGTNLAALFYPGLSQTTKGTISEIPGGMNEARVGHTATRLLDGRVLIAGGAGSDGTVTPTAEVYTPSSRTFTPVSKEMETARRDHVAVLLNSGDVLLAGGRNDAGSLSGAEIFRVSTGTFETVSSLLSMGDARSGAAATKLPDGRVLVTGGRGDAGALATSEIYDPALSGFGVTDTGSDLSSARAGLTLTGTLDATYAAVAAGGMASPPVTTIERFDWMTDGFSTSSVSMRDGRAYHAASLLGDGRILLAGGQTTEGGVLTPTADLYDPSSDTLDLPNGDMQAAVKNAAVAILRQGRPVIFGGLVSSAATDTVQVFTPDGGFNQRPIAQIVDMLGSVEPWSFGVRIGWRAIDQEGDPVRIVCQYQIKEASGDDSDQLSPDILNQWLPATMRDQTVLGDRSSGLTALSSRQDFVDTVDNPIDAPDVDPGEHLFVWYTEKDIPKGDYSNVFFRIFVYGAEEGTGVQSARFSIAKNAPVIARIDEPLNTSGNLVVPFYLQDSDQGDLARLEWEYGLDQNDDGKIVEADGEAWKTVTRASVGSTVSGTTYHDAGLEDVVTGSTDPDPNNDKTVNGIPYGKKHYLVWDSVYDLGAPASPRSDVILRLTPYDYPSGSPGDESLGISQELGDFTLSKDPDGLYLTDWYASVAATGSTYEFNGVKLDESIVFEFTDKVDPASLTAPDGTSAITVRTVSGGTVVNGYYHVDGSTVTFYPQVQEIPARTDILSANTGYSITLHGYDPTDRSHAIVKRLGADPSDTNARMLLRPASSPQAFRTTSGSSPSQLYLTDGTKPAYDSLANPVTFPASTSTGITIQFDDRLMPGSVTPTSFIAIAPKFAGADSVVPGSFKLENIVDENGPGGSLRRFSRLTLTPSLTLPPGTTIEVRIGTGLKDLYGNKLGSATTVKFDTAAKSSTVTSSVTEGFDDTDNRDGDETTAFWGTADPVNKGSAAGSGVAGKLTGLYDGGDGSDDALDLSSGDRTITTNSTNKGIFEYTSVYIPGGRTLTIEGSETATLRVQQDARIYGMINASGLNGANNFEFGTGSNQKSAKGGTGGPGGGDGGTGGNYTYKQNKIVTGGDGEAGAGDSDESGPGEGGTGTIYSGGYYYGGGGGGGGHASEGGDGDDGYTYYGRLGGSGGGTYGSGSLSTLEAGAGGGSGSAVVIYYTYYGYYGAASGAGGGGGGGGVKISANGEIDLSSTGRILADGGDGGRSSYYSAGRSMYAGGGGGGAGGSVFLQADDFSLDGTISVLGGDGGDGAYTSTSYPGDGGDGGDGRIRLERAGFKGKLFTGKLFTSTTLISTGNGGSTDWKITSDTTVNTDTGLGIPGYLTQSGGKVLVDDFVVDATVTVEGSKPFMVEAAGKVEITGKIVASGLKGSNGSTSRYGSYNGWRFLGANAGEGGPGGFDGGAVPSYGYSTKWQESDDGVGIDGKEGGEGAGLAGEIDSSPYAWAPSSSYTYYFYYYSGGGGGGGGATAGKEGTVLKRYISGSYYHGTPGEPGDAVVDGLDITASNLFGGAGGGGGSNGGYKRYYSSTSDYHYSYGPGAAGGGGGGAILVTTEDTMLLSGGIFAPGGVGGDQSYSGSYSYYPGVGGGGAGGNVVLQAKKGFTFGLMTIAAEGGAGGTNWYGSNNYGTGGDGGNGAIVLRSGSSLDLPPDLPSGAKYGDGTMTGGDFTPTKYGVSAWFDTGAVAPEYTGRTLTGNGGAKLYVEGTHTNLLTGEADTSTPGVSTGWVDVSGGDLSALNGHRFFRFRVELLPVLKDYPEVSSVRIDWEYDK